MGHHFSKSTVAVSKLTTTKNRDIVNSSKSEFSQSGVPSSNSAAIGNRNQINLHIEESTGSSKSNLSQITASSSQSGSLDSVNFAARQIIIKIQLAKMENGNDGSELPEKVVEAATVAASSDLNANTVQTQYHKTLNQHQQQQLNLTLDTTALKESAVSRTISSDISSVESTAAAIATTSTPNVSSLSTSITSTTKLFMNNSNLNGIAATSSMAALHLNNDDDVVVFNEIGKRQDNDDDDDVWQQRRIESADDANDSLEAATAVEYCEVLEQSSSVDEMLLNRTQEEHLMPTTTAPAATKLVKQAAMNSNSSSRSNSCCHNKSKSSSFSTTSNNKQRRCAKCKCRDAIRGIREMLEPSSTSKANKQRKDTKENKTHSRMLVSEHRHSTPLVLASNMSNPPNMRGNNQEQQQQFKRNSIAHTSTTNSSLTSSVTSSSTNSKTCVGCSRNVAPSQLSIWAPACKKRGDVIIHISTPNFVVEQCEPVVTVGHINDAQHASTSIRFLATEFIPAGSEENSKNVAVISTKNSNVVAKDACADVAVARNASSENLINQSCNTTMRCNQTRTPIVHSQIDFVHYLVPDLERILNSSFYWGKMDRYEAERLLEGMPEGTFLLRDSAQEEFLFSVTFRKYERSLHARIEQSGHKFSFDCHDPCVFTAPTVTGLLEHYKDPSCVMFFEPMLTIPLHRKNPFSLQQLCRATVVSHTTYDGINQLELPTRLKAYMKEYHYKQKLRVKPFDEPFYSCT